MLTRLAADLDLEEENLALKTRIIDLTLLLDKMEHSNGADSSWLQHKCSAQRNTLRVLSNRVRCQRLVLGLINRLGRLPSKQELQELIDQMKEEFLDPVEITRAVDNIY